MSAPSQNELIFRLVFSIFGLVLLAVAIWVRGIAHAGALVEVVGIAGLFFGGTAVLSMRQLLRRKR